MALLSDSPFEDSHHVLLFSWPTFLSENSNVQCAYISKWIWKLARHRGTQSRTNYLCNHLTPNQPHWTQANEHQNSAELMPHSGHLSLRTHNDANKHIHDYDDNNHYKHAHSKKLLDVRDVFSTHHEINAKADSLYHMSKVTSWGCILLGPHRYCPTSVYLSV